MITNFHEDPHLVPRAAKAARLSWDSEHKSDSNNTILGPEDKRLLIKLCKAGSDHSAALRQAVVHFEVAASRGWWQQMAKYRHGVEFYSSSIMHTGLRREYTQGDFRHPIPYVMLEKLNEFAKAKDLESLTNIMPEGLLQRRAVMISYPAMRAIYHARSKHRKPEWREFLAELVSLVRYPELICAER